MSRKIYNVNSGGVAITSGQDSVGNYIQFENGIKHYALTAAITGNVTTTTAATGSRATTTNSTGRGKNFRSDGTKWQDIAGAGTVTPGTHQADAASATSSALTDNTAGTANTTLQALADGTTYATDVAAIRNNFADLAAAFNALRTDYLALRTAHNALLDALEANSVLSSS